MVTETTTIPKQAMQSLTAGAFSEEQARQIVAIGPEAAVFALLELAEQRAKTAAESHQTPATPSGMKPPAKLRKRRPGAKQGHLDVRRECPNGSTGKWNIVRSVARIATESSSGATAGDVHLIVKTGVGTHKIGESAQGVRVRGGGFKRGPAKPL